MKFAFMSFSTPTLGLRETLALANTLGYRGIEPRVGRGHGHGLELERTRAERREMAQRAIDAGVEICCLATGIRYSDSRDRAQSIHETVRYLQLAADVNCRRLRVFGGALPEGVSREAATEAVVSALGAVSSAASDAGVTICMETHDAWTNPAHVAEVMGRVNHPFIAVNWDVMHPQRTAGVSVSDAFETLRPWIRHTHIHDGLLGDPLVMKRCGEGEIDLERFFAVLHAGNYDGYVSGEWIDCEGLVDLSDELARMRRFEARAGRRGPMKPGRKINLPPCGIFIGSGIYHGQAGYLARSGRTHTAWVPQSYSPGEMLEKVIEDNQGNLVQFWGLNGGWGFDGANAPVTMARFHALEDLGIIAPQPDWENRKYLSVDDWNEAANYPERYGAGVLKFVKQAAELGIYSILLYTDANPEWSKRFCEAGDYYLGYDFGESFSFRLEEEHVKEVNQDTVTLKTLADDLVRRVRLHVEERHAAGWGNIMATSANFHLDYEVVAGAEIPLAEDFAFSHLNMASSLSRGLSRQFDLPLWGSHMAHEHYSWIPFGSEHKFDLFRAAMLQKYMAGAKIIINESGNWFLQTTKAVDSPLFEMPSVELGNIFEKEPHRVAPYVREAERTFGKIDYHSPIARRYRKEISDFYDYVKIAGTPDGQPEATVAIAKGNYDLSAHEYSPNAAIAGMYTLAEKNPCWFSGQPERGWNIVKQVFYPRPPVLAPHPNRFLSGTPYGMVDIVSFADDGISADFLSMNYKALLFSGWNTASETQYGELCRYVRSGGILFISIPHLSTNVTRDYASYGVEELVHRGDFSELCGVRVKKRGRRFYWATAPDRRGELGFEFPRRFGIMTTCLGEIEITDPDHEVLAVDDEEMEPLLIRRRYGKGTVYFLNSWAYPGAMDMDEGPGATLDSPGLIGMIYRHIARQARGSVWITDDGLDAGKECEFISYSYFPEDGTVCLLNIDFKQAHRCHLHRPGLNGAAERLRLAPGEFRRFHIFDDLAGTAGKPPGVAVAAVR